MGLRSVLNTRLCLYVLESIEVAMRELLSIGPGYSGSRAVGKTVTDRRKRAQGAARSLLVDP